MNTTLRSMFVAVIVATASLAAPTQASAEIRIYGFHNDHISSYERKLERQQYKQFHRNKRSRFNNRHGSRYGHSKHLTLSHRGHGYRGRSRGYSRGRIGISSRLGRSHSRRHSFRRH